MIRGMKTKMKTTTTALSLAVVAIMVTACGGAKSSTTVNTPPTNGGTTLTTLAYTYDKAKFNVVDNAAPTKQVRIEIADLDVQKNAYLQHSVQKIFKYIQDYQNGTITAEDLTNVGIAIQDPSPTFWLMLQLKLM